jgi:hypothetical protein
MTAPTKTKRERGRKGGKSGMMAMSTSRDARRIVGGDITAASL